MRATTSTGMRNIRYPNTQERPIEMKMEMYTRNSFFLSLWSDFGAPASVSWISLPIKKKSTAFADTIINPGRKNARNLAKALSM